MSLSNESANANGEPAQSGSAEGEHPPENVTPIVEAKKTLKERLVHEVKTHPFGYSVLAVFVVGGPFIATMIFPQAPPAAAAVGGLAFGIYAAICTVPQKFM